MLMFSQITILYLPTSRSGVFANAAAATTPSTASTSTSRSTNTTSPSAGALSRPILPSVL